MPLSTAPNRYCKNRQAIRDLTRIHGTELAGIHDRLALIPTAAYYVAPRTAAVLGTICTHGGAERQRSFAGGERPPSNAR